MRDHPEDPNKTVIITGFPRSGNTYLTRLIADCLNSPVSRFKAALPLATEGEDRPGDWYVTQLHMLPIIDLGGTEGIVDANHFNIAAHKGEKIILIVRDPRDVAISAMHYWDLPDVTTALNAMHSGDTPFDGLGNWNDFNMKWTYGCDLPVPRVSYEYLWMKPVEHLLWLLHIILGDISDVDWKRKVTEVVKRQEFETKREQIVKDFAHGIRRPYGKEIQLKHLRKGIPGEWHEVLTYEENNLAMQYFGDTMAWQGYGREGFLHG